MYREFDYRKATSLQEVFELTKDHENALLYAGGTDILVKLRALKISPELIIDVKGIDGFNEIRENGGELIIGAAVTLSAIQANESIIKCHPALCDGVGHVGSVPIRNKATLAGNIQNASPAGDGLIASLGLAGSVLIASADGERRIPLDKYCVGPGKTLLQKGEIITGIAFPAQRRTYERFFKVGRRNALAISVVNGLVAIDLAEDETVADCSIAVGAVAPVPIRLSSVEERIKGNRLCGELIEECAGLTQSSVSPISDIRASADYRRYIAGIQVMKSLRECMEAAGER